MLVIALLACGENDFVAAPDLAEPSVGAAPSFDSSSTCAIASLIGTSPEDGAVGVAPTLLPLLEFDAFSCGLPFVAVEVVSGPAPNEFTAVPIGGALIRLEPDEPLAAGLWELLIETDSGPADLSFEVDDAAVALVPPEAVDVVVDATRNCDPTLTSDVTVTVTLGAAAGVGVLRGNLETENGLQASEHAEIARSDTTVSWQRTVLGGREVCADIVIEDETGAVVHTPEPTCAPSFEGCPADEDEDEADGSGCSTSPTSLGGTGWLVWLAVGSVAARRRALSRP